MVLQLQCLFGVRQNQNYSNSTGSFLNIFLLLVTTQVLIHLPISLSLEAPILCVHWSTDTLTGGLLTWIM